MTFSAEPDTAARALTPNHLARRSQLITAAQAVLRREGLAGCTSRAIARESNLNNGLIHYYFGTVDAIVDAAMQELVDAILDQITDSATTIDDPAERFWSVVEAHLQAFESPSGQTVLWMDYWVSAARAGRTQIIGNIDDTITTAIDDALRTAQVPDPRTRARAICAYVTGVAIRRQIRPQTRAQLRAEIRTMSGLPTPPAR